ncbi:MAG: ATP synthase subunit C [Thiotrichales bacterium]
MTGLLILMALCVLGLMVMGTYLELRRDEDKARLPRWVKGGVAIDQLVLVAGLAGLLVLGVSDVLAADAAATGGREFTVGLGLALIGVGLPTGLAAIGAGIALGPVGSAALAVIAEKPEVFGRTLIYLGLAEGIAIYGLVMSILLLGRI